MPSQAEYRDIFVIAEAHEGKLRKSAMEVLTKARELADLIGCRVIALVGGEKDLDDLGEPTIHHGADQALLAEDERLTVGNVDAYHAVALPLLKAHKPEIVLVPANPLGLDLAPRLAAALGTGVLSDATQLDVDETDRLLVAKRLTYDGSVEAAATIPNHRPQIASLRPGAIRVGFPDDYRYGQVEKVDVSIPATAEKVRLVGLEDEAPEEKPLAKAEVVVAGGNGFGDGGFDLVQDLARALGGTWAASRAAVQFGLAPAERQVGATGAHVAPDLYVAAGVSGQFEHYYGVRKAGAIVGINADKSAPLFKVANYGLVGDAQKIIPAILEELKRD